MTDIFDFDTAAQTEEFRSEFDEKSLGMLADVLSTLYANPERSVMREYIANGIDAHTVAGVKDRAVKVTLPTTSRPDLVVQDFGDGLSKVDMQNTFFKYHGSTKTDDDDQIGALGIGAKSAFALTRAWTVVNVFEGKKFEYTSINDSHGAPIQKVIVDGEPTDEPSGIKVVIPIGPDHIRHPWAQTAAQLYKWFPKGSVEFTNHTDSSLKHWTDLHTSVDNVVFTGVMYRETFSVVMCGIEYDVDRNTRELLTKSVSDEIDSIIIESEGSHRFDLFRKHSSNIAYRNATNDTPDEREAREVGAHRNSLKSAADTVFNNHLLVDTGAIDFMPSRESVKGTPRTRKVLMNAALGIVRRVSQSIMDARELPADERVRAVEHLAPLVTGHTRSRFDPTMLIAMKIPNVDTPINKGSDFNIPLHTLLTRHRGTLVTGVPAGRALTQRRKMEDACGVVFYTTETDTPTAAGYGDLRKLFAGNDHMKDAVVDVARYREVARKVAPVVRGASVSRHDVWTLEYDPSTFKGKAEKSVMTFGDFIDEYESTGDTIYVLDYAHSMDSYAAAGVSGVAIVRGRRQVATFSKELKRDVKNRTQLDADRDAALERRNADYLDTLPEADVRAMAVFRHASSFLVSLLSSAINSRHGSVIPADHRVRELVREYARGEALLSKDKIAGKIFGSMDSATAPKSVTDTNTWVDSMKFPLFTDRTTYSRPQVTNEYLEHAALYIASV